MKTLSIAIVSGFAFALTIMMLHHPAQATCTDPRKLDGSHGDDWPQCLDDNYNGQSNGGGSAKRGSPGAAAAIGIGTLIIQGLANSGGSAGKSQEDYDREAADDVKRRQAAPPNSKMKSVMKSASADTSLDPWANKNSKNRGSKNDGRAPYVKQKCVEFRATGTPGTVDWDFGTITNKCKVPVQVLTCFYDKKGPDICDPKSDRHWGVSDTIAPGKKAMTVSTSEHPGWLIKYFVCDMTNAKRDALLCLRPKTSD
ncbi:hypothetical protein GFM44_23245 [Rhizobium leguminosarum bv. viciae]|nr:hypothetical protein [Rhizobium leguminosarum bv. viciae]